VVELLQLAVELPADHVPAADQQHRRGRGVGGGQPGHGVGHSWTRGHGRHAETARQPCVRLRCVCRRLLVPHVDDPDALGRTSVEDRENVAPRQREDCVDPLLAEGSCEDLTTVK
jgi:hypothetical protein